MSVQQGVILTEDDVRGAKYAKKKRWKQKQELQKRVKGCNNVDIKVNPKVDGGM